MAQQLIEGISFLPGEYPQDIASGREMPRVSRPRVRIPYTLSLLLALTLQVFVLRDIGIDWRPRPVPRDDDGWGITFLTRPEAKHLMRYHGVHGFRIADQTAFIKRDGSWICIFHDPPTEQELKIVRRIAAPLPERAVILQAKLSPTD